MTAQLLSLRAAVQRGAESAAEAILQQLCEAAGEPRQGPWIPQLERLLNLLARVSGSSVVGSPAEDMAEQLGVDDVDAEIQDDDENNLDEEPIELAGPQPAPAPGVLDRLDGLEDDDDLEDPTTVVDDLAPTTVVDDEPAAIEPVAATTVAVTSAPSGRRWRDPRAGTRTSGRALDVDVEVGRLLYPSLEHRRPAQRGECGAFERPCPYVSCRHHLFLEVKDSGTIVETWPAREPWDIPTTCSLDVADLGGSTLDEIAELLDLSRERVRQIEQAALRKLKRGSGHFADLLEDLHG